MDPDRVAAAVPTIASALADVDGITLTAGEIDDCADSYVDELDALSDAMDEMLSVIEPGRRNLVTNHEALAYFADRFDFDLVGAVIPSTSSLADANPRDLDDLETTMRENGVDTIFAETTAATALAEALAARLGADAAVVELYTESLSADDDGPTSYVEMMQRNAELVASALSADR
jgi:zinc/manganese transport system substrate-binding protein